MMRLIALFFTALVVSGCVTEPNPCEEIEKIVTQRKACDALMQRIKQTKQITVRTTLEEQYKKQCIELRYYRDNFEEDTGVCSDKQ